MDIEINSLSIGKSSYSKNFYEYGSTTSFFKSYIDSFIIILQ